MPKRNAKIAAYASAFLIITGLLSVAGCGGKTEDGPKNDPSYYTGPMKKGAAAAPKGKTAD